MLCDGRNMLGANYFHCFTLEVFNLSLFRESKLSRSINLREWSEHLPSQFRDRRPTGRSNRSRGLRGVGQRRTPASNSTRRVGAVSYSFWHSVALRQVLRARFPYSLPERNLNASRGPALHTHCSEDDGILRLFFVLNR